MTAFKVIIVVIIVNVVSIYVPYVGCKEEEKDKFWQVLASLWSDVPNNEKVALEGD